MTPHVKFDSTTVNSYTIEQLRISISVEWMHVVDSVCKMLEKNIENDSL